MIVCRPHRDNGSICVQRQEDTSVPAEVGAFSLSQVVLYSRLQKVGGAPCTPRGGSMFQFRR